MREYRNQLARALNAVLSNEGEHSVAALRTREALEPIIDECDRELAELNRRHRPRAFDEDSPEDTFVRALLRRGITPYAYAKAANPDVPTYDLDKTSEKVTAQKLRTALVKYYKRSIAVLVDMFEDARAGAPIFAPIGEVIVIRRGERYVSRFPTPMDLAREIHRLEVDLPFGAEFMNETIDRLTRKAKITDCTWPHAPAHVLCAARDARRRPENDPGARRPREPRHDDALHARREGSDRSRHRAAR